MKLKVLLYSIDAIYCNVTIVKATNIIDHKTRCVSVWVADLLDLTFWGSPTALAIFAAVKIFVML